MPTKSIAAIVAVFLFCLTGCKTLRPYERVYINDPEMSMGQTTGQGFEYYIHSIREGATPAGGGKSSGGCGCN